MDQDDTRLKVLKEFASCNWKRELYYSEVSTTPEVSAIKTCEIKVRYTNKSTMTAEKHEFMWTFSSDDTDFIDIVLDSKADDESTPHDILVSTPCLCGVQKSSTLIYSGGGLGPCHMQQHE